VRGCGLALSGWLHDFSADIIDVMRVLGQQVWLVCCRRLHGMLAKHLSEVLCILYCW
jgi:hypothetical protein